jgi:CBS domain-containing protein
MIVEEIMSKDVVTIDSEDSIYDACLKFKDNKVGCLIVIDKDSCIGIVTERDIITRTICNRKDPAIKIKEIMSPDLKIIQPSEQYEKALELMKEHSIKKIPVVIEDRLVGIITLSDIAHARPDLSDRFINSWVKPRWQ